MRRMPGQMGVIVGCSAVTEGDLGLGVFCPRTRGDFAVRALLLGGVVAGFVCDCWARAFALRSPSAVLGFGFFAGIRVTLACFKRRPCAGRHLLFFAAAKKSRQKKAAHTANS